MSPPNVFVLMVTDGTVIEYPPEIYFTRRRARQEAERWAWILAGGGWVEISEPFPGRWEVAGRDVRLSASRWSVSSTAELWTGTFWTEDGYPDPEAVILSGREEARRWVSTGPGGQPPTDLVEHPWMLAATYRRGDEEAYAVAHLAKVIATHDDSGGRSAPLPNTTT